MLAAGRQPYAVAESAEDRLHVGIPANEDVPGEWAAWFAAHHAGDHAALGGGHDVLTLGDGGIVLIAAQVELLRGGAGDDTIALTAASGGAMIQGGSGNDSLSGGGGADTILGGPGADILKGGAGADLFVFGAVSHSAAAAPDTILDFNPQQGDALVLAGLAAGVFRWRGAAAFTAGGAVEGRYDAKANSLLLDLDGDGAAEMAILVPGIPPAGFDGSALVWV